MEIDGYLRTLTEGLPPVPKRYQLRCHPDVYLALRDASARRSDGEYIPDSSLAAGKPAPLYGSAAVVVTTELSSGGWELYEDGQLLKRGQLGAPSNP